MSSALIWQLVKNNNAFLVKRGRSNRAGAVQFSSEPGNVLNVNSFKYSGLANASSVHVSSDLGLSVKDGKNANKPKSAVSNESLTLHAGKSGKRVVAAASVRPDLSKVAKLRFNKVAKANRVKKGYSKKAAKSTRRGAAKP
eukprot:CAMPEP_0202957788 /NCGR_PEP_ID=MMETSP1396-20130829/2175_1 /ASSEMBLY_ACC=CAM_ASM_000872 /TAXON_ID= /ORGANISM="Pseudokeronopsis sp., Strain Brazil" /LENGTH=140 /DNA_ID=CAMNT_0049675471 /DNA_START=36 /DNA_END=458 /DNA_ORIENTATION=-